MSNYKLTYFDFDGGRGEPVRIALHAAGLAFEDIRWSFPQFGEQRASLPFQAVPTLEMDGKQYSQSNALCRYVGKQAGLYPDDALAALHCDEVMEALEDLNHYVVQTFGLDGDELIQARERLLSGRMSVFLPAFERLLERGGGQYFAGNTLSVADLKMFVQVRSLSAGTLDHIPADSVQRLAPMLVEHCKRIASEPVVTAYYASRQA